MFNAHDVSDSLYLYRPIHVLNRTYILRTFMISMRVNIYISYDQLILTFYPPNLYLYLDMSLKLFASQSFVMAVISIAFSLHVFQNPHDLLGIIIV